MAVDKQVYQIEFKGTQKAKVDIKDLKGNIIATSVAVKDLRKEVGNFSIDSNKMVQSVKITSGGLNNLQKSVKGVRDVSGSATSSVLEMGRAISDSNYGIRGMANNLSQLASNLVYTAKAAGGIGGAFIQIKNAMLGPLGIILLFQSAIALLERMSMEASGLEDKLKDLNDTGITESVTKLMLLRDVLNDTAISISDKNGVIRKAREEYEDLNIAIDNNGIATAESVLAIDAEIDALMRSAKAKAINQLASEIMVDQIKAETSDLEDNISWYEKAWYFFNNPRKSAQNKVKDKAIENRAKDVADFQLSIDKLTDMLKKDADPDDPNSGILLQWLYGDKKGSGRSKRRIRELKLGIFNLAKFIDSQNKEAATVLLQSEVDKLKIQQDYELKSLETTKKTYIDKAQLKYDQFIAESKNEEANARALATLQKAFTDAGIEYDKGVYALKEKQLQETLAFKLKMHKKYQNEVNSSELGRVKSSSNTSASFGTTGAGSLNRPLSNAGAENLDGYEASLRQQFEVEDRLFEERFNQKSIELFNNGIKGIQAELILGNMRLEQKQVLADREADIERRKIQAMKNVNSEYISWLGGIGSIMKNIAGENEDLAKAALIIEKGAAIADIYVKTSAANQAIKATAGQSASEATSLGTLLGARAAGYAATGNVAQAGLASKASAASFASAKAIGASASSRILKNNIGAGISIAGILSTTLQSRGGLTGGSAGVSSGGSQSRNFDFNLVGSTGQDQLAAGIAGQQQEPIQAYVVASQITSAQQLNNTIQSNASIG